MSVQRGYSTSDHSRARSALPLGPLVVRNRLVFAAHLTNLAVDGLPTAEHAEYYAARAAGGVGLIVTEEHCVHPDDRPYEKLIRGHDPAVIPGYRRITDAVHAHGVPILAQLNHNGGQSHSRYSRRPVWAPSPVPDPLFREVPHAVTVTEIAELVACYARVAEHCVAGGFDGVEVQCSHSSILRQFLATGTNLRRDDYGGPLTRRARVLLEVVSAIRAVLGPDRVLGVRLGGDDRVPGGVTLDDAVETAALVADTGAVDYLNTSIGTATGSLHLIEASMHIAPGYADHVPRAVRARVNLPVVAVGRCTTAAEADRLLADGVADLVGVVRGQIADPGFARAVLAGRDPDRRCPSCNQDCVGRVGLNQGLDCVVSPRAWLGPLGRSQPRTALVIGGGPAGLAAAASAAARGHRVTLWERAERVGGQVRLAAAAPGRGELAVIVDDLAAECARASVELYTGHDATTEAVRAHGADVVVLATGSRPMLPPWAVPGVVDVRAVLAGEAAPTGRVLVVDELGYHPATSVAELLAERGARIHLSTPALVIGQDLGLTLDVETWRARMAAYRPCLHTEEVVMGARRVGDEIEVTLLHHLTGTTERRRYDAVVCATPPVVDDTLAAASFEGTAVVHRVGDRLAPRRISAAVREGRAVGESL